MRAWVFLECGECGNRYYRTSRPSGERSKLELKKFCPSCRSHTVHKERKK